MSKTGNMPAFPLPDTYHPSGQVQYGEPGLTKREYIAIEAMAALITTAAAPCLSSLDGAEKPLATLSFKVADAMLEESEKRTGQ